MRMKFLFYLRAGSGHSAREHGSRQRCILSQNRRSAGEGVKMRFPAVLILVMNAAPAIFCQTDWPAYGHDPTGNRYSPLTQVSTTNVSKLKLAWQYGVDATANDLNSTNRALYATEAVPIMAGGLVYTPTVHHTVVALEPETGKEVWKYEL